MLTADGVAEAVVPMAVAALRDRTGSYSAGFLLLVGLAALGAVAVAFLPRARSGGHDRRRKEVADLRSQRWFGEPDLRSFGHRSRAEGEGFAAEDFMGKPVIAILNTWSDAIPATRISACARRR